MSLCHASIETVIWSFLVYRIRYPGVQAFLGATFKYFNVLHEVIRTLLICIAVKRRGLATATSELRQHKLVVLDSAGNNGKSCCGKKYDQAAF